MTISEISKLLSADICACADHAERSVSTAFAGDMLSDVLALSRQPDILLTGLLNPQVIRTAEMLDTACVIFLKGKVPTESILELARERGIVVLTTSLGMFTACGLLGNAGIVGAE